MLEKLTNILKIILFNNNRDNTANKTVVREMSDFELLANDNVVLGEIPTINNSIIAFNGKNNILYCERDVVLSDCNIAFNGNNSLVYLSQSNKPYHLVVAIYNNNVCYIGKNNYFNGNVHIALSEHKHVFIGNNCLFSFGVWIRNADPHLIYNANTGERSNPTKSIFVGDHVWLGQSVILLKGTKIDSGSIVGAMSVASGLLSHNAVYGGNPIRKLKDSIFWDGTCVHGWNQEDTAKSMKYSEFIKDKDIHEDDYIFEYNKEDVLDYEVIDDVFDGVDMKKKIDYLAEINRVYKKNRFVHLM